MLAAADADACALLNYCCFHTFLFADSVPRVYENRRRADEDQGSAKRQAPCGSHFLRDQEDIRHRSGFLCSHELHDPYLQNAALKPAKARHAPVYSHAPLSHTHGSRTTAVETAGSIMVQVEIGAAVSPD